MIVLRLTGTAVEAADISFRPLPPKDDKEKRLVAEQISFSQDGAREGMPYIRGTFTHQNPFNPCAGYEGLGKVIANPGETLVLVKIRPVARGTTTNEPAMRNELDALPTDYDTLLARARRACTATSWDG